MASYRGVVPILGLVIKHVEPGVLVEAGVVVRSLDGGAHVEAVWHSLQSRVPDTRRDNLIKRLFFASKTKVFDFHRYLFFCSGVKNYLLN